MLEDHVISLNNWYVLFWILCYGKASSETLLGDSF